MKRWDRLNNRQLELLNMIAEDTDLAKPEYAGHRHSANALRDRGFVILRKRGAEFRAELTDAGRFYLKNGHHTDDPRYVEGPPTSAPTSARPSATRKQAAPSNVALSAKRKAEAEELINRIAAEPQGLLIDGEQDADELRKKLDFAKRHGLVPAGHYIERTWRYGRKVLLLREGEHPNSKNRTVVPGDLPPVEVPETLRRLHPVVAELRNDKGRLVMPVTVRHRALLILQGLTTAVTGQGYEVEPRPVSEHHHFYWRREGPRYRRPEGELSVVVDGISFTVNIKQVSPQSANSERAENLRIEVYPPHGLQYRWADGKRAKLEEWLPCVVQGLAERAVIARQERAEQERKKAERAEQWKRAMEIARSEAEQAHYAKILDRQIADWSRAKTARAYRDALDQRLKRTDLGDQDLVEARRWLSWIDEHIKATDPVERLPRMPPAPKFAADELKPFLRGWSPYGPG